jgi:hypothetical protein
MALQNTAEMNPEYLNQYQQHIQTPNLSHSPFEGLNPSIPELLPGQAPVSFDPTQATAASFGFPAWTAPFPNPTSQSLAGATLDAQAWYADQLRFPRTRGPE